MADGTSPDWLKALDIQRALANCHVDMIGDWYRDPWGWPELNWVTKKSNVGYLLRRLNTTGVYRAARLDVAKENFGVRPAVVLDPLDRLAYQALVDAISKRIIGTLPRNVFGWRLPPDNPRQGIYARNDNQWQQYRSHLLDLASWYDAALKTDIVQCFASVSVEILSEMLIERAGDTALTNRLISMLEGWALIPQRSGLPQRSMASSVLAHLYLAHADDVLSTRGRTAGSRKNLFPAGRAARWMDDIWIFGDDPGRLRDAQMELQDALQEMGLHMNLAKTDVFEGERVMDEVGRLEHSAVDAALPEVGPLNELLDEIISRPEHADRTTARFCTTRMRTHEIFDRVGELAEISHRIPQAADHLARLFRDSQAWRDLQDWFVTYAHGSWGGFHWSTAQLGTMFPSKEPGDGDLRDFFAECIEHQRGGIALQALAAQRLAAWDREAIRSVLREAASRAEHPLHRRVLALAGLAAGETRTTLRRLLGEFEENAITLAMLEDVGFKKIKPKLDFEG